ncbi:MAG: cyclic nucleotide-binding domain-containing protein [Nitrospirota bacterium]
MANKKEQLSSDLAKFVEQSQWAKAVQAQQALIDLEPTNSNYFLRMGDYNVKAGNKAAAVKAYYQAADLFVKAGFAVKGIATYKMILRVAPDEKQATELMRAINSNPAVTGGAPPPPPAPAPAPQVELAPPPEPAPAPAPAAAPPPPIEMPQPAPVIELELEIEAAPVQEKKDINPLFAAFSKEEFGAIVDKLEPVEFMAGERIIAEGDEGDAMYLISSGGGRVVKEVEGQELTLDNLAEGEFFGEMSLLVGGPRSASVFAATNTEVLRLKSSDLFEIMKKYPRIESVLEEFYEKRSKATRQKMKEIRK